MNGKVGFNRLWQEYQYGFGKIGGEHWIGTASLSYNKVVCLVMIFSLKKRYTLNPVFNKRQPENSSIDFSGLV